MRHLVRMLEDAGLENVKIRHMENVHGYEILASNIKDPIWFSSWFIHNVPMSVVAVCKSRLIKKKKYNRNLPDWF